MPTTSDAERALASHNRQMQKLIRVVDDMLAESEREEQERANEELNATYDRVYRAWAKGFYR